MKPMNTQRGYTLMEVMVVVVVLGIAGAMVIPSMGQTGILRVQGAVRTLVSDMTFIQADAVAFQEKRAIVFDVANSTYTLVAVPGTTVDPDTNTMYDPLKVDGRYRVDFRNNRFGDARLTGAAFDNGSRTLIFDAMGGPLADASGNNPGAGGTVRVNGSGSSFIVTVEAFTGRITVERDRTFGETEAVVASGG